MGRIFQAECWEKHPSVGVHLVYYGYINWQRKWSRHLERKNGIFDNLFTKIKENRRKGR